MALPERTPAQRADDLARATETRHERALIREQIKTGELSIVDVFARSDEPVIARMKVEVLIESLPGFGKAKAEKLMDELGIAHSRRIQGLGSRQKTALLERFE